jgi:hypothetical protein
MQHPSDTDPYAAPAELFERFDYIAWLQDFWRDQPVVWLVRQTRTAIRIGRIDGDRYPSGRGREEHYGLWVPAVNEPQLVDRQPDDPYGYGTQSAALLAYLHDLQGDSSSALANLKVRDPEIAARVDEATALDNPERVRTRGRATLANLGAWPWAVVEGGVLPSRTSWWTEPTFTAALRNWDEDLAEDLVSIDPWRTSA